MKNTDNDKMPTGINRRMKFAEILCKDQDGNKRFFPYMELKKKVGGNIGIGRRFILDGVLYCVVRKDIPSNHMPNTNGNYRHTRFEYRMAQSSKGKI